MKAILLSRDKISTIESAVSLPLSKSIFNRLLIMDALRTPTGEYPSLATNALQAKEEPNDIHVLAKALYAPILEEGEPITVDMEDSGSSFRFFLSYAAFRTVREVRVTGKERLMQRPIQTLVDALNSLGGKLERRETEEGWEVVVSPSTLRSGTADLREVESSQFITSLLLIAPYMEDGVTVLWNNRNTSNKYIDMTVQLLKRNGIRVEYSDEKIVVHPGEYKTIRRHIEYDWSSALYWFSFIALAPIGSTVSISTVHLPSMQGDAEAAAIYRLLGVHTNWRAEDHHLILRKERVVMEYLGAFTPLCMRSMPDAAPTLAVTLALLGIPFHMTGLETLPLKESHRLKALRNGLASLGIIVEIDRSSLKFNGDVRQPLSDSIPYIEAFGDHRIAMSFAAAIMSVGKMIIDDAGVVQKSYPKFWEMLQKVGVKVSPVNNPLLEI